MFYFHKLLIRFQPALISSFFRNSIIRSQYDTPSRIGLQTKEYLEAFGYEVKVYVGFMPNKNSGIMWYKQCIWNNFMEQQGYFKCNVENGQIEGYNVRIENDNFEKNYHR